MPRLTNSQMRISAAEKGRLRLDRQSQRDRRRARISYKKAAKAPVSVVANASRWVNP